MKVDGYYEETNEVFVYSGCFWHGCLSKPNRQKPIVKTEVTLENRYEETKARLQKIEKAGYRVVSIWGVCLENTLVKIHAFKIHFVRTTM